MTVYFPDVSGHNAGIDLSNATIVLAKATEGTTYVSPAYVDQKAGAAKAGAFFGAYHFLRDFNIPGQIANARNIIGNGIATMLDLEPVDNFVTGGRLSSPTIADALAFIDGYRKAGGICHLLYFPKWYWQELGSKSLQPFIDRGMLLVSSRYVTYTDSDSGEGWQPYGGMTPTVWQYTSQMTFGGKYPIDFNAFRGTHAGDQSDAAIKATIAEFKALALTGKYPPPPKPPDPTPDPVPDPKPIEEDNMITFFVTPTDSAKAVAFPAGQFERIQILQDWPDKNDPPKVRVAVHSLSKGWKQIETRTLTAARNAQVVFKFNDANGVSVSCLNTGHAIGLTLS